MKTKKLPDKVIATSPCAGLAEKIRQEQQTWKALYTSLVSCFAQGSGSEIGQYVIDPFQLAKFIGEVRKDSRLSAHIGEPILGEIEAWAKREEVDATESFDARLRSLCNTASVAIDGRFPSYLVSGFLVVRVPPNEHICQIGAEKVSSLSMSQVWPRLQVILGDEKLRNFSAEHFVDACHRSYLRALAVNHTAVGSPVAVKDLFRELIVEVQSSRFWKAPKRQNFTEYTEEYFGRDIGRLMSAGHFVADDGARMELRPTAFPKDGIAVTVDGGVRFIGHVVFGEPTGA